MSEFISPTDGSTLNAAHIENEMQGNGLLYNLAQTALVEVAALSVEEVTDVILPPKRPGDPKEARWQLVEQASGAIKQAAEERRSEIFSLAERLGMREPDSLSAETLARIDSADAIWVVESGANRTSVVRRQLAIDTIGRVHGPLAYRSEIYQLGSDRVIPRERNGQPNPEYSVALEIAGDHLPDGDSLTEFELNLASALSAGFEIRKDSTSNASGVKRVTRLMKPELPELILVLPVKQGGGLKDGFSALDSLLSLSGWQLIIATNGQYRPKDELQAKQWARDNGVAMMNAVALGDEPGYSVEHNGRTITTADRPAMAYVNEMVILHRLQQ